jgi:hypothetical protein
MSEIANGDEPGGRSHWGNPHASAFVFFVSYDARLSRYRGTLFPAASASLRRRQASGGMIMATMTN